VARTELDDHLRTTAIKSGARAIDGARAVDVRRDGDRVTGVVFARGDLRAEPGKGRYLKRPPFGPQFDAAIKRSHDLAPTAVAR
jgi:hypothetical protein